MVGLVVTMGSTLFIGDIPHQAEPSSRNPRQARVLGFVVLSLVYLGQDGLVGDAKAGTADRGKTFAVRAEATAAGIIKGDQRNRVVAGSPGRKGNAGWDFAHGIQRVGSSG